MPPENATRSAPDLDKALEVGLGGQLGRSVDDHRDPSRVCYLHDLGQCGASNCVRYPEHGGSPRTDGGVDLPGLRVTLARSGKAVREPDLDDPGACRADGVVVGVALAAHHHDLVGNAAGPR